MFIPKNLHNDWLDPMDPLFRTQRLVFVDADGRDPGNVGAAEIEEDEQRRRRQQAQEETEARREEGTETSDRFVRQLEQLAGRQAISNPTLELAMSALSSSNDFRNRAAKMLAKQVINENTFEIIEAGLTGENSAEKSIARQFVKRKFNTGTLHDAISDLESGNTNLTALARRLGMGRIDQEEYLKAKEALDSNDENLKWAAQMLAQGNLTPQNFRQQLNMAARAAQEARAEGENNVVNNERERVHDRIIDVLMEANVIIEELPERERTRPLLRLRENLKRINNDDKQNRTALATVLKQVNENEEKVAKEEIQYIWDFIPRDKEQFKKFKDRLDNLNLTRAEKKRIISLKERESDVERQFLREEKLFGEILRVADSLVTYEVRKQRLKDEASKAAGIQIEEGTQIQYLYPDPQFGDMRTVTIKKIEFTDRPIVKDGQSIGRHPTNMRIHLDNGETHNLGRFMKWVDSSDVHESIRTQAELEESLGFHQMGVTLKAGQSLEYNTGLKKDSDGHINPNRGKVQVTSVGDNEVQLSEPVTTLRPEQAPHAGLQEPRRAATMNLGEFAKWARREEAIPDIRDLEELREILRNQQNYLNQTNNQAPENYSPPSVENGEIIQWGDSENRRFKIKKAKDDGITLADGTEMTLPQFFNWARENQANHIDPDTLTDRQVSDAQRVGEEVDPETKSRWGWNNKKKLNQLNKPPPGGDGSSDADKTAAKKSVLERMKPYIPQKESPYGPIREVYEQTTFLSIMDVYNMGKEIVEFVKRKHNTRSKSRFGRVGSKLPSYLGTEMKRIEQSAENEEVNQYKESFEQLGSWDVLQKLHNTNSRFEAKACFITLTEKGELRWDDKRMWGCLNRLTARYTGKGSQLFIKQVDGLQKSHHTGEDMNGEDMTKYSIDELWGEGQFAQWFSSNINSYNSQKSAYEFKGKQLEHDPKGTGGLSGEMTRLLKDWKAGKYVNPQEYEELIDFGIKYGKMSAEQKMFFLIEGVSAKAPSGPMKGMTLLHLDRIGDLDGQYLNQFPMLDFFTNKLAKPLHPKYLSGELAEPPIGGYKVEDYEYFRDHYFKEESDKGDAGTQFSKFLWEYMIVDPYFRLRLSKGLRRADDMDHDDAHMFIPPAGLEEMQNLTGSYQGQQKFFTPEGYKNAYTGFNQYIVSLSQRREDLEKGKAQGQPIPDKAFQDNAESMLSALQGYFRYDSYLDGRDDIKDRRRARLDRDHYNQVAVNDLQGQVEFNEEFTVGHHQAQLNNLVKAVCEEYGIDWKEMMLFERVQYKETGKQSKITNNMHEFLYEVLPKAFEKDKGRGVFRIVQERKMAAKENDMDENSLRGLKTSNRLLTGTESRALADTSIKDRGTPQDTPGEGGEGAPEGPASPAV